MTSSRRIPVQKEGTTVTESPGAISRDSAARADSIAALERARQDSLAAIERARQDSIAAAAAAERARQEELARIERARLDSIARAEQARRDSIAAAEAAAAERFRVGRFGGWYFNLGGGISMPRGALDDLYGNGWNVTGSVGWHPTESPFGVRFDATYDRLNGQSFPAGSTNELADASVLAGLAEVTLRVPRALGLNTVHRWRRRCVSLQRLWVEVCRGFDRVRVERGRRSPLRMGLHEPLRRIAVHERRHASESRDVHADHFGITFR